MSSKFLAFFLLGIISCSGVSKDRRSLDKVTKPHEYPVFKIEGICDSQCVNEAWKSKLKRFWVLSNLSHAAYYDKGKLCKNLVPILGMSTPCYYAKEKPRLSKGEKAEVSVIRIYDEGTAQGFLMVWPDKAVLSFRGTESDRVEDLLADASFFTTEEGKMNVHSGFKKSVDLLWEQIEYDLKNYTSGKPVWATGHSLGAAMAVISGMRYPFKEVVTFGEPIVGYGIEDKLPANRHIRVVNGNDPVTKIIPKIKTQYMHSGTLKKIFDPIEGADIRYDHAIGDYSDFIVGDYSDFLVLGNNSCKK